MLKTPSPLNQHFAVEETRKNEKTYTATCKHCKKQLKASIQTTSNFITHLKRVHPAKYEEYKRQRSGKYVKIEAEDISQTEEIVIEKNVAHFVADYIIDALRPLCEVENPQFKAMINGIISIGDAEAIPTAVKINEVIREQYSQIKTEISDRIDGVDYFTTTTCILSCGKQIFIGMCLHWIDEESFEQETAMLCCRRFKDQLIPEQISAFIAGVYQEFDIIPEKVVKTTINGDLNKINAISLFDLNARQTDNSEDDPLGVDHQEGHIKHETVSYNSLLTYNDAEEIFKSDENHSLPPYHKCCSYILNLLVVYDTAEAMQKEPLHLRQVLESTIAKCAVLFTKINSSNEFLRFFHEIVGEIPKEDYTRWRSEYDLLNIINRTSKETLSHAFLLLELDDFSDSEYECLQEYTSLLKTIVDALRRFENKKNCFYGEVVPVLYTLKAKLQSPCKNKVSYCNNIRQALAVQLTERFGDIFKQSFNANDALLAAISNPFFKRRWIKNDESLSKHVTDLLITTADSIQNDPNFNEDIDMDQKFDTNNDDYFDFVDASDNVVSSRNNKNQILTYLDDSDTSYACLNKYSVVKNIFALTNITLPSTMNTNRIFAEAAIILSRCEVEWEQKLLAKQFYCKYNSKFLVSNK